MISGRQCVCTFRLAQEASSAERRWESGPTTSLESGRVAPTPTTHQDRRRILGYSNWRPELDNAYCPAGKTRGSERFILILRSRGWILFRYGVSPSSMAKPLAAEAIDHNPHRPPRGSRCFPSLPRCHCPAKPWITPPGLSAVTAGRSARRGARSTPCRRGRKLPVICRLFALPSLGHLVDRCWDRDAVMSKVGGKLAVIEHGLLYGVTQDPGHAGEDPESEFAHGAWTGP